EPERSAVQKRILEGARQQIIEREVLLADMFAKLKGKQQVIDKLKEAAAKEFEKTLRRWKGELSKQLGHPATDQDLNESLSRQGNSLESVRRQHERQFMAMEYLRNVVWLEIEKIGHPQIRQYYDAHPDEFQVQDRVEWQDIFIDAARYPSREADRQAAAQDA